MRRSVPIAVSQVPAGAPLHAMTKKRHTVQEIRRKLHHAEKMVREGKLQNEIAHALGISVMTYHRWRKAQARPASTLLDLKDDHSLDVADHNQLARLGDLQLENSRLRRLVTDLLLEKVKLEEELLARARKRHF
jgi:putative transposase